MAAPAFRDRRAQALLALAAASDAVLIGLIALLCLGDLGRAWVLAAGSLPLAAMIAAASTGLVWAIWRLPATDPFEGRRPTEEIPVWFEGGAADGLRVRAFDRDVVDLRSMWPIRVNDRLLLPGEGVLLREGDRIAVGRRRLVAHVGWRPDPDDPLVGGEVAGRRLWRRRGPGLYETRDALVEWLPIGDPAAWLTRARAAEAVSRSLLRVRDATADAIVYELAALQPVPDTLDDTWRLCRALAPLHRAGIGHGRLDAWAVAPGSIRLRPVAEQATVDGDVAVLRERLGHRYAGATAADLSLAIFRDRGGVPGAVHTCARCGVESGCAGPPRTTMFDGFDRETGRMFGGRVEMIPVSCVVCGLEWEIPGRTERYRG